jgi:CHAD domain-containing protein
VKARRVKGLDPAGPLADQLARIVQVRLDELCAFMPQARTDEVALHDMRIAAKRLRYILEVAHPLFGEYATRSVDLVKDLQELLGDIHDADVQVPEVRSVLDEVVARDAAAGEAAHREHYAGLLALVVELQVTRRQRFERFLEAWEDLERKGFRARLVYATHERPGDRGSLDSDGGRDPAVGP